MTILKMFKREGRARETVVGGRRKGQMATVDEEGKVRLVPGDLTW